MPVIWVQNMQVFVVVWFLSPSLSLSLSLSLSPQRLVKEEMCDTKIIHELNLWKQSKKISNIF